MNAKKSYVCEDSLKYSEIDPSNIIDNQINVNNETLDDLSIEESDNLSNTSDNNVTDNNQSKENEDIESCSDSEQDLNDALELIEISKTFREKGEYENALQSLDEAYFLACKPDTNDNIIITQQKDDFRLLISRRILEIYASRNFVTKGSNKAIPIIRNKHVDDEIASFTVGREKKLFIEAYKRSGKFRPMIVKKLKMAGLPTELSWLPLIESGFKVRALSPARALGLWQFIPSTGYKFGLKRDTFIDERMDPEKATDAAIEYLKELHQIFGDWTTVLAAYNCGEGRVLRIIRGQNVNYLDNFWDLYELLPRETARYVPRFLATLHIINNISQYELEDESLDSPLEYENFLIAKQISLKDVANTLEISSNDLEILNPELRHKILPNQTYNIKLPLGKKEILESKLNSIATSTPPTREFIYHRIKSGESLSTIAKRYKTTVKNIAWINKLNKYHSIRSGKLLKIPLSDNNRTVQSKHVVEDYNDKDSLGEIVYKVKEGDALWIIAKKFKSTPEKIMHHNNLLSSKLAIGQRLKIPRKYLSRIDDKLLSKTTYSNELKRYQVKEGDSPFSIAKQHNMEVIRLLRINNLTIHSKIYPGQELSVE
ncbi:MAG: LysM peptidoglycan-binding domain-containing protein [Desulfobacterales bacterium]|nr:LysM peptidoglycan-binding domain-containing protein [Desulfobacterales bacterium]